MHTRVTRRPRSLLLVLSLATIALACGETMASTSSEPPLVISPASQTLHVPRTLQVVTEGGRPGTVTWSSSDEAVASVSATGLVTAVFPGSATIVAQRGPNSATLSLVVTAASIDVGPGPVIVALNGTKSMTAIVRDADGAVLPGVPVDWHTANASIATVGLSTGVVSGVSPGSTTITASGGGASAEVTVLVNMTFGARLAFSSIGTSSNYVCGLEAPTGLAWCWGDNHSGALGIGDTYAGTTAFPLLVSGGLRFSSLSVGFYANCGIEAETGFAFCWGNNANGELGDGTFETRSVPTKVANGRIRFSSISSSGDFTCGIEAQTDLPYCWGIGGLLGDGTLSQRSTPTLVGGGGLRLRSISAGGDLACGVEVQTGLGYCWGSNKFGQLGDGTTIDRLVPTLVGGGHVRFSWIEAGVEDACGIEAHSGLGYCWGSNRVGQLGDGTTVDRLVPTLIAGGNRRFRSIEPWWEGACGIEAETNAAYCWGRNHLGQLGDGTTSDRLVPTLVGGGTPRFTSIGVSGFDTCGVEVLSGLGYCWGYGELVPYLIAPPLSWGRASGATEDGFGTSV